MSGAIRRRWAGLLLTSAILAGAWFTGTGYAAGDASFAYVGPGAGLSAIGAFLALIAAVLTAVVGFIWYPIKRVVRFFRGDGSEDGGGGDWGE
jgi:hypothetical protein